MKTLLSLILVTLFTGCATLSNPQTQAQVAAALEGAAKTTAMVYVGSHPQSREKFAEAAEHLESLALLHEPSPAELHAILAKLPIKELRGTTAQITVGLAETTYRVFLAGRPSVEVPPAVREFASALARGIRSGLP